MLSTAGPMVFDYKDPKGISAVSLALDAPLEPIVGYAKGISGTVRFDPAHPERSTGTLAVDVDSVQFANDGYTATARGVDTTTIHPDDGDLYRIENGGAGSSHRLDGLYQLLRAGGGGGSFVGQSASLNAEVRLTLRAAGNALTLQEEYRRDGGGYRFRNRFDLTR